MKTKHTQKQRLFSLLWSGVLFIGFAAILHSCYPGDPLSVTDTDVVTTFRDANATFADKTTYAMPDSVLYVTESEITTGGNQMINDQILSAIRTNLEVKYDYTETDSAQADVHVVALVTTTTWTGGTCYPGYWDWWYPYPGWCYPVAYSYQTGTLLIVMVDPTSQGSNVQPIWLAGINGVLSSTVNAAARINKNVNQAFDQSPYLGGR